MARIFVSLYNFCRRIESFEAMVPFYESFLDGLKKAGNDVLCFQHKTFDRQFQEAMPNSIRQKIIDFNPEICILFNNSFWDISHLVECPIVIYDTDSPALFANKDLIKQNIARFKFVVNQTHTFQTIKEYFSAQDSQIKYIPFFTELAYSNELPLDKNIVFLGTNWTWKGYDFLQPFVAENPDLNDRYYAQNVIKQFQDNPLKTPQEIYEENGYHAHQVIRFKNSNRAMVEISGLRRLQYLDAVADLGLEIRGNYWNIQCMNYFPRLLMAYNSKVTLTKEENENFYNSAKIAINTKHIQAVNGFSFRVCDILASNACLVTEKASDMEQLFKDVHIPSFTSPAEVREVCLRLLQNENERYEIVSRAHEVIEKNFRFKNVLEQLEDFLKMSLRTNHEGNLEIFSDQGGKDYEKYANKIVEKKDVNSISYKVGMLFGYDPNKQYKVSHIKLGKIKCFRILNLPKNEKYTYLGYIPLLSIKQEGGNWKLQLLVWLKFKNFIRWILRRYRYSIKRKWYAIPKLLTLAKLRLKYLTKSKIKVCLFCSRISDWELDNLYNLLEQSGFFIPYIVLKPFMSQGHEAMVRFMEQAYSELSSKGYRVIKTYEASSDTFINIKQTLNPDIVFYTMYWLPHFHKNYYIDKFYSKISIFTSYSFDCMEHPEVTNFEINNMVDMYFMPCDLNKKWAQKNMYNKGKNVFVTGTPKLDPFFDSSYCPKDVWKTQTKPKKRVIWAPHHSDHFPKWQYQCNSFYEICDDMFKIAEKYRNDIQIAFKPHPMLKEKLNALWGIETTQKYYDKWANLENGQLEEGSFIDLFMTSDAMILDSLSFIAEYTAVNKPALFTIGKTSRVFLNPFGKDCFENLYIAKGNLTQEIEVFIQEVILEGNDYKKGQREAFIKENIMPPHGKDASRNIYDLICQKVLGVDKN